jgi:DNA-binding transcriptional ArsR family regulator
VFDLETDQKNKLAETFGLLSDPTRLSIVLTCMDGEVSAGKIATKLNVSPSLVSHHLRLLRSARIMRSERRGKHIFYKMTDDCVRDVLATMIKHLFAHDHFENNTENEGETVW